MLKVVIVDDEWMIREGLRTMIPWTELGMEVRGTAANGIAGLELVQQEKPDLLLTDIRMPGFSGLELMSKALQELPRLKSIILTGYGEFRYAQEAVKIGAFDFILKPTDEGELISILHRAKTQLEKERNDQRELLRLQCYQYVSQTGLPLPEALADYFTDKDSLVIFAVGIVGTSKLDAQEQHMEAIFKNFLEGVDATHTLYLGADRVKHYFLLHSMSTQQVVEQFLNKTITFERDIQGNLWPEKLPLTIGVSELVQDISKLPSAFYQANMAIEQQLLAEQEGVFFYTTMGHQLEMEEAIQIVDEQFTSHVTLNQLASRFFMSDSYFSRLFKQYTGKNFVDYVAEKRVQKAQELLKGTALKTYEIAQGVGYPDQRYFSQIFKKATGFTPSEYRQQRER